MEQAADDIKKQKFYCNYETFCSSHEGLLWYFFLTSSNQTAWNYTCGNVCLSHLLSSTQILKYCHRYFSLLPKLCEAKSIVTKWTYQWMSTHTTDNILHFTVLQEFFLHYCYQAMLTITTKLLTKRNKKNAISVVPSPKLQINIDVNHTNLSQCNS